MKKRSFIAVLTSVCLLALTLIGCANTAVENIEDSFFTGANQKKEAVAMGRYVEQNITLPQLGEAETIVNLLQVKDTMVLYTSLADSGYYAYRLQTDGTWMQEECQWITGALGKKSMRIQAIRMDANDALYLLYFDGEYKPHIIKTSDEKTAEELTLPFLENKYLPNGYAVMGNGNLAISYLDAEVSDHIFLYDGKTGEELHRFKMKSLSTDNICNQIDARGEKLAVPSEKGNGFTVYDTESGSILDEITINTESNFGSYEGTVKIGENENYYYLSSLGLQHIPTGASIMETIIDGSLSSIGVEGIQYKMLLADSSSNFHILFQDAGTYDLVRYTYDASVPTLPETQLSIYGLTKNKSVSRAIATYQKEHPTVQITYYTAQSAEGATTASDSIRTLNTELLSGKGADILVLDGLPIESYMEKGVLLDLSELLSPMYSSGDLLENFTKGYDTDNGNVFAIPSRFTMPILLGDKEINQAFLSMDTLRQYVKDNPESDLIVHNLRTVTYDELAELIFLINYKEIMGSGSNLNQETLIKFLETVKETGTAMGATLKEVPIPPTTEEDLKRIAQFILENAVEISAFQNQFFYPLEEGTMRPYEIRGMDDMMEPVSLKSQYGKEISSVNNYFIPTGIIGINASSTQIDNAKEFVRCLLSEEEQHKDLGSGMPVNANALERYSDKKSELSMGVSAKMNGKDITLSFEGPSKEEAADMIALAKTLTNSLNVDEVFKEMLLDEAKPFFEGTVNAQTAAKAILSKASTYLSE